MALFDQHCGIHIFLSEFLGIVFGESLRVGTRNERVRKMVFFFFFFFFFIGATQNSKATRIKTNAKHAKNPYISNSDPQKQTKQKKKYAPLPAAPERLKVDRDPAIEHDHEQSERRDGLHGVEKRHKVQQMGPHDRADRNLAHQARVELLGQSAEYIQREEIHRE
jgi:hypothetical protein